MVAAFAPPSESQPFGGSTVLSDIWDEARRSFRLWADSELGAETAIESESTAHQALTDAQQAPHQSAVQGFNFSVTVLLLLAGLGLVIFLSR